MFQTKNHRLQFNQRHNSSKIVILREVAESSNFVCLQGAGAKVPPENPPLCLNLDSPDFYAHMVPVQKYHPKICRFLLC